MTSVKYFDQSLLKTFRQNEVAEILKVVSRGESLQLVAPSGSGKSLLIQQLTEKSSQKLAIIAIDFNLLADKTPAAALSFLESSISVIGPHSSALSVVLIFDHFENILDSNMKDFLNYLKGYYVKNRPHISYIFATERPILETNFLFLSGNLSSVLTENIYPLPSLCQQDIDWIIKTTAAHYQVALTREDKATIAYQSGGYLRIIKYLIHAMVSNPDLCQILKNPTLDLHLSTFMCQLAEKTTRVVNFVLPPIFNSLQHPLSSNLPQKITGTKSTIEDKLHLATRLTKSEAKIADLLFANNGCLVSREEVARSIWGKDTVLDYTDHALDQLVSRLNKKLALASPPIAIATLRGRGYRLSAQSISE